MVINSIDEDSLVISARVQETIDSIKEIVKDHSDADIYAALKENGMDPNETAQKLLRQDPFHVVKRRRDRKKELTDATKFLPAGRSFAEPSKHVEHAPAGRGNFADPSKHVEHAVSRTRYHAPRDQNVRRGGFVRKPVPGARVSREFRVVRDHRVNQNTNHNDEQEAPKRLVCSDEHSLTRAPNNRSAGSSDQKHSTGSNSDSTIPSAASNRSSNRPVHANDERSSGSQRPANEEHQDIASTSQKSFSNSSVLHPKLSANNSVGGVYSSISDPVHVPSPDSRPAGIVGTIRREVGVVGSRRHSSATVSSTANNSFSNSLLEKDISSQAAGSSDQAIISKSNGLKHLAVHAQISPKSTISRATQGGHNNNKLHHPNLGHQKVHSNMEWKPKSGQKAIIANPSVHGSTSSPSGASNSDGSNVVEVAELSEKLSQFNILDTQHVIIPQHILVPETERTRLTFGSFGDGFVSAEKISVSNTQQMTDESALSTSKFTPVSNVDVSHADHDDNVDSHVRTAHSDSSLGTAESLEPQDERTSNAGPEDIESYADIGLVQSTSPAYGSTDVQQLQNNPSLSGFSAYENQTSYDVPFFSTVEDSIHNQGLTSSFEAVGTIGSGTGPLSAMTAAPPQQFVQPQQSVAQMFPQVHIPHYVPYRHIFSPVYVPPMALPNYSSNPAYPHPSNGNSYVLMPGGTSHLNAGGMKYSSQYKPVPAASPTGYGSYPNPPSFANSLGAAGNVTSFEDLSRIKYKDNSMYAPNAQADAADMWIQTPRDLQSLQSPPYYNVTGQVPSAAFMPTHAGHAFNAAAQTSHVTYPGLYHPQQPASVANPHHLVHQPVAPSLGGSVGLGVAAPGPQVGTYQQPQLGHLNWTPNF